MNLFYSLMWLSCWINSTSSNSRKVFLNTNDRYVGVFTSTKITWDKAFDYCENKLFSSLASIHNDTDLVQAWNVVEQFNFSYLLNAKNKFGWIGLNDKENEGVFIWVDNSSTNYNNEIFNQSWISSYNIRFDHVDLNFTACICCICLFVFFLSIIWVIVYIVSSIGHGHGIQIDL